MQNLFAKVIGVSSFSYCPEMPPGEANWVLQVVGVSLSQNNLSQKPCSPQKFLHESKAVAFFSTDFWETNISNFMWQDSSVTHKISLKRLKKRAWWLRSSMNLSGLRQSTFRVYFGREQRFLKDCYCLMRSVTTHPLHGINAAPCWASKACWQLVVMMLTHVNTLGMF